MMWGLVVRRRGAAVRRHRATGLAWAARGWVLAVVGWAIVWVPGHVFPDRAVLAPEAGLTLAAFGLALALGIGVSVLVDGIRDVQVRVAPTGGDPRCGRGPAARSSASPPTSFDGRWGAPDDRLDRLARLHRRRSPRKGQFRMLWVGDPTVLPLDPVVLHDGTGYTLTRNGSGNVTEQWRAPEHDADHVRRPRARARTRRAHQPARSHARADGRALRRAAEQSGSRTVARRVGAPAVRRALGRATRPRAAAHDAGVALYENLAYVARSVASVPAVRRAGRLAAPEPSPRSAPTSRARNRSRRRPPAPAPCCGARRTTPSGRRRRAARPAHTDAFGWANGYRLDAPRPGVDRVRRAVAALGDARRRARDLDARGVALASHPACGATRSCGRPRCAPGASAASVGRSPSTTSSTTTRSGGSGCERPRPRRPSHRRTRKVRRGPILLVVLAAVVAAVVVQQGASSSDSTAGARPRRPGAHGSSVPSTDVVSTRGTAPRARRRPTAAPTRPSSWRASRRRPSTPPSP